ncbi:MAG: cytochrome c, partial [Thermodesulfobacteriota bacterium]
TKNGIKMTGMPAFGLSHSDQEIWSIVAFLKQLPDLTPEDYDALKNNGSFDFDIPPEDEEFYKHKH